MVVSELPEPPDEETLYREAKRLGAAGRHEEALPLWRALTSSWPSAGAWMLLTHCLMELHRWVEAESAARAALDLRPDSWTTWRELAMCLEARGCMQEAKEAYDRSLGLRDNPATRVLYASMLSRHGDVEGARRHLESCTRTFPEWGEAWFNLGCSWEVDDPERALSLMQCALEIEPDDGYYHARMAYVHGVLAHVEQARQHLREARRLGSGHAQFDDLLGEVSTWLQKIDRKHHARRKPAPE
jgi:Flp pilus assembly protein TadD